MTTISASSMTITIFHKNILSLILERCLERRLKEINISYYNYQMSFLSLCLSWLDLSLARTMATKISVLKNGTLEHVCWILFFLNFKIFQVFSKGSDLLCKYEGESNVLHLFGIEKHNLAAPYGFAVVMKVMNNIRLGDVELA